MPVFLPTEYYAEILWLGAVLDREATLASNPIESMDLTFAGPAGEVHGGLTRLSCSRVTGQYPRKTEIRNVRQLSVVSQENLDQIAGNMGLPLIKPHWIGASVVVRGIPDFTRVPPSSRLIAEEGPSLVVDMENRPCNLPVPVIRDDPEGGDPAPKFKAAAKGLRGVTAWVEREGSIAIGDRMRLHIPDQPAWTHLDETRG